MIDAPAVTGVRVHHMRVPEADETRALLARLTPAELARVGAIRNGTRQREHIASRVLAKYLVLRGFQSDEPICEIGAEQLAELPAGEYREIDVSRADGAPRVFRRGVALADLHLSIAHSAGTTAVGVSTSTPIGIDVATIEEHAPSFHRVHYSQRERDWVARGGEAVSGALFTLLWTLKECLVKAGGAPHATLWGYDEVEVLADTCPREVADRLAAGALLTMAIRLPFDRVGRASCTRIANTILSFVAGIQEA
ncbi:MAG: hypothetical protein JWL61_2024 [Gemmatimonadetes bacterium]|nr:hypothetical protein [Gemmatimonadota bacterium]